MSKMRVAIVLFVAVNLGVAVAYVGGWGSGEGRVRTLERRWEAPPDGARRVLFLGNSHTARNDLPGVVQHLGRPHGEKIWVRHRAPGGVTLRDHRQSDLSMRLIRKLSWDVVVLQPQSVRPIYQPREFIADAERLAEVVRENGAEPILYGPWAKAQWSSFYERLRTNPDRLREVLAQNYEAAATGADATVAPVARAFGAYRRSVGGPRLRAADGNHATPAGTYLAASVLYRVITGREVADADFVPYRIDPEVAAELRRIADRSVEEATLEPDPPDQAAPESESSDGAPGRDAGGG